MAGDIDRYGKTHMAGWNSAHTAIVYMLLDEIRPRKLIRELIHYAYDHGYEHTSDGISFPVRWWAQLGFQQFQMKHPVGVMHDCLYREGPRNPYQRSYGDDIIARRWADRCFGFGLWDFGNWFRANTWEWGLRLFGYQAYQGYREREKNGDYRHIMNLAIIPQKRNAT